MYICFFVVYTTEIKSQNYFIFNTDSTKNKIEMKKYQINTSSNSENIVEDSTRKTTRKTRIEGSYDSALFIGSVFISTLQNKTSGIYQLAMFYVEDTAFSNPLLTSTAKKFVISEVEEKQLFDTLFLPKDRETETYRFQWTISDGGEIIDTYTMPTVFTIRVSENEYQLRR